MIEAPRSRYRVIERDRRLVVVDSGEESLPNASAVASSARPNRLGAPRRTGFDGRAVLTTSAFYDLKGPRTLTLDPGASTIVNGVRLGALATVLVFIAITIWQPAALALLALLFQRKIWKKGRESVTAWLDQFDND